MEIPIPWVVVVEIYPVVTILPCEILRPAFNRSDVR